MWRIDDAGDHGLPTLPSGLTDERVDRTIDT
jgi:hypothetical protein